ncbi:MAG TPA: hypothetical protein VNU71_13440 [Burkholderiaceae bacterium]|nr:hypothetical protein [Burkholderiaceae bacterium]
MDATERHRHECEVRFCIAQGFAWFAEFIKGVSKHRGKEAAQRLWDDVRAASAAKTA